MPRILVYESKISTLRAKFCIVKCATRLSLCVSGEWFSTVQIVSDDLKQIGRTKDNPSALDLLWQEISPQEKPHLLSLFTMKKPGGRGPVSDCSVYQTPFSIFILFDDMVLRADQPFEFVEVAPRKSKQRGSTTSKKRSYRLKCKFAGTKKTFILFRSADLDKKLYLTEKDLMKDVRLPFFLESFIKHLNEVEEIIDAVNIGAKRLNPQVTTLLSMQMFVDAVYSEYIKRPSHFSNQATNNLTMPIVDVVFGRIAYTVLRYLLEYGLTPNEHGRFSQAKILRQDINSGSSSRHGISLTSMQEIIKSIDVQLAKDFSLLTQWLMSLSLADSQELRLNSHLYSHLDDCLF